MSTTELRTIDNQLSKNRAVGRQARQRMKIGPIATTKVRNSFARVTTKSAMQRKITEPIEKTTAASKIQAEHARFFHDVCDLSARVVIELVKKRIWRRDSRGVDARGKKR